ncbi:MAG: helix-turn-helix transcriptional regulator [Pseudomonadota bacterium]|nr:helix-turn-helix transcriptional regulator [Pseudomonadota bacterium]
MELEKLTRLGQDEEKRRYDDACAAAHGMDLIGDRWAMPVVRELLLGPRRFGDIKGSLRGVSANVLSQRLDQLEEAGVLIRRKLPPPASVQVYELTRWGYEAAPIFQALGRWAVRSPRHDPSKPFTPVSLMLSLRTMFSDEAAGDFEARIQLVFGGEDFLWERTGRQIRIGRGQIDHPDFTLTGPPAAIAGIVYGGAPLSSVETDGDMALAKRFMTLFPLPKKAA